MVNVIGLWNFRLLGSTVTIGLTATRFPNILVTNSDAIGWACQNSRREDILLLELITIWSMYSIRKKYSMVLLDMRTNLLVEAIMRSWTRSRNGECECVRDGDLVK